MIILNLLVFGTITSMVSYIIYKMIQKYKNKRTELSLPYHGYKFGEAKDETNLGTQEKSPLKIEKSTKYDLKSVLSSDSDEEDIFINP